MTEPPVTAPEIVKESATHRLTRENPQHPFFRLYEKRTDAFGGAYFKQIDSFYGTADTNEGDENRFKRLLFVLLSGPV